MSTAHPLSEYLSTQPISQTDFAKKVGISRTHLYRIMRGDSTTTATLAAISAATGNKVSQAALIKAVRVTERQLEGAR